MSRVLDPDLAAALASSALTRLTHFTPSLNLPNIIGDGELRSTIELGQNVRVCYRVTDLQRLDRHPDKLCCSLQYPNAFYLDIARRGSEFKNYPDWVCLLLDKDVAAAEGTLFNPRNAAAGGARPGAPGFRACYATSVLGQGGVTRTRGPRHHPGSPTDVQAEALIVAPVPLGSIHAMVFPSEAAAAEEYGRLDRFGTLPPAEMHWVVSRGMFDKWAVKAAVQSGRGLHEALWYPTGAS